MKRFLINTLTALLTFVVGVTLASPYTFIWHQPAETLSFTPETRSLSKSALFREVFYDFVFVGADASSPAIISHDTTASPWPATFEVGQQYIFHRQVPTDNDRLFAELQNRFREKGIRIRDAKGGVWRYVGGLKFNVSFQDGRYTGQISHALDRQILASPDLSRKWAPDDYILVIKRVDAVD